MRLIDADALEMAPDENNVMNGVGFMGRNCGKTIEMVQAALRNMIDNAPTIDAVPVVRCKDCKHYAIDWQTCRSFCVRNGKVVGDEVWGGFAVDKNGYCNYGAKMDLK